MDEVESPNTGNEIDETTTGNGIVNTEWARRGALMNAIGKNFPKRSVPGSRFKYFWGIGPSGVPEPIIEGMIYDVEQIEINTNLISAIIVDTKFLEGIEGLVPLPNLVVAKSGSGRVQLFYFLEKYIRRNAAASLLKFLESVSRRVRLAARGQLIEGNYCLSPFCLSHRVFQLAEQRYTLNALKPIAKAATRVAQAEAGIRSAGIVRQKSIAAICKAIVDLHEAGEKITQVKVAQRTGLGIATIKRCWKDKSVAKVKASSPQSIGVT